MGICAYLEYMKWLTYGNAASRPLVERCYSSFVSIYPNETLTIYCLDLELYEYCSSLSQVEAVKWYIETAADYARWSLDLTTTYQIINRQKFKIIQHAYKSQMIWFDLDVIHLRPVTEYLQSLESGIHCSIHLNKTFCTGVLYFNNINTDVLSLLTSVDYDDERILIDFFWRKLIALNKLDLNIISNPELGKIPTTAGIVHFPGITPLSLKLRLIDAALNKAAVVVA